MNIRLFFKLIIIESILMVGGLFGLILFWFLYFGSGAGASSSKAIMTQNTMLAILVLLTLLFGVFKYKSSYEIKKRKSYLFAGLAVTILSGIYFYLTA